MSGLTGALGLIQKLLGRKAPSVSMEELSALRRVLHPAGDPAAREALYTPPASEAQKLTDNEFNRRMIATEMQKKLDEVPTTAFYRSDNSLAGAYQLSPDKWDTDLSYLLSNQPGLGTQLLEDAYRAAKQLQPDRRVRLNAIPGSEEFYRKQRQYGWNEGVQEGMPVFIRKAQGGLAQARRAL